MSLSDIIGQPAVVARLLSARRRDRLSHSYLFSGEEGTGREETALALSQAVLCETPSDGDSCGQCGSCRRVAAGSHPDVQLVMTEAEAVRRGRQEPDKSRNPSTQITIEPIRELGRRLRMHSYEGTGRVGIVLAAHRLRVEAANALLKTLEEPAPGTLLVLVAPGPRSVLDTLKSRCQIIRFAPLSVDTIAKVLVERSGIEVTAAQVAAERAEGSLLRAQKMCEEGVVERAQMCRAYLDVAAAGHGEDVLDTVAEIGRERQVVQEHLDEVARLLHDRLCLAAENGNTAEVAALGNAFSEVSKAKGAVAGNAQPQLTLEALAFQLQPLLNPIWTK